MPTPTPNYGFLKPLFDSPIDEDLWGDPQLNGNWAAVDTILNIRTQPYDFGGFKLDDAEIVDAAETVNDLGNISGAVVVNYEDGHVQHGILTGNISSLTINNFPASGKGGYLTLELSQDAPGSRTLTLSAAYLTAGGAGISLSTGSNALDRLTFTTRDAGTSILTTIEQDFS